MNQRLSYTRRRKPSVMEISNHGLADNQASEQAISMVSASMALIYLLLFISDIRWLVDEAHSLLFAPILIALTAREFAGLQRRIAQLVALLLLILIWSSFISESFLLNRRNIVELGILTYLCCLRSLRSEAGLTLIVSGLGVFYLVSSLVFLITVFVPGGVEFRQMLYPETDFFLDRMRYEGIPIGSTAYTQIGLTHSLVQFGYQLATGFPLVFCLAASQTGAKRALWLAVASIIGITLLLAGQRSAVLGSVAGIAFYLMCHRKLSSAVLFGLFLTGIVGLTMVHFEVLSEARDYSVINRLELGQDGGRLYQQVWALSQIPSFPMGHIGAGVDYGEIAPWVGGRAIGPHNGYITSSFAYGWVMCVIILSALIILCQMARVTFHSLFDQTELFKPEVILVAALVGVLVNALFHNQSFASFEANSVVVILLYCVAFCSSRKVSSTRGDDRPGGSPVVRQRRPDTSRPMASRLSSGLGQTI